MRLSTRLALLPLLLAVPALAQDGVNVGGDHAMLPDAMAEPSVDCLPKIHCIVVVNQANEFNVTGFYINDGQLDRNGQRKWFDNLFRADFTLQPHKAWWMRRMTDLGCVIHARVDMRAIDGRKLYESQEAEFDLCKDKAVYTIIQVNPMPGSEKAKPTVKVIE